MIARGMVDVVNHSSITMLRTADVISTAAAEAEDKQLQPSSTHEKQQEKMSDSALILLQTPPAKTKSSSVLTAESENTTKTAYTTETETDDSPAASLPNQKNNETFQADEDDEEEEEKLTEVDAHFYPHYEIVSRWNDLTQKRLDLCRQRVDLEQRLFEFAELRQYRDRSDKTWHSFRDPREEEDEAMHDPLEGSLRSLEQTKSLTPSSSPASPSSSTDKLSAFPTLCSVRWETVNFPDGQIYEGQVLVLLKRSPAEPEVAAVVAEEKKSRRGLFGVGSNKEKKNKSKQVRN